MAVCRDTFPILEYDDDPRAVLEPTHEDFGMRLPEKAVFAFLGDVVDRYALEHGARIADYFISATKNFPIYIVEYDGEEICLAQAPVGAPAAVQIMDFLIGYGAKKIISTGSCGALAVLEENVFLLPTKALRDEGTSYHYLPPSRFVETSENINTAIRSILRRQALPFEDTFTWTTDGFYRETREKIALRRQEGCKVVEMECAALAAYAKFRGADFGQILYTADTLANVDSYDMHGWGKNSVDKALALCLEVASAM